ncbi:metal-sensitive transcriptional regulator, partial [Paracoccus fontiphilus]
SRVSCSSSLHEGYDEPETLCHAIGLICPMGADVRHCIDILNQTMAVRSALSQVELMILQDHADACVQDAILSQDTERQRQKFQELVEVFGRVCR